MIPALTDVAAICYLYSPDCTHDTGTLTFTSNTDACISNTDGTTFTEFHWTPDPSDAAVITVTVIRKPKAPPPPVEFVLKPRHWSASLPPRRVLPRPRQGGTGTRNWQNR